MKTVTTREVQHHFSRVLEGLRDGESVQIKRRGEVVAVLSPPPVAEVPGKVDWSEHIKWHQDTWKDVKPAAGNVVLWEREGYDR